MFSHEDLNDDTQELLNKVGPSNSLAYRIINFQKYLLLNVRVHVPNTSDVVVYLQFHVHRCLR